MQIPELRKVSRRDYLVKRRAEKVVELKDDIADEEFLFSESKLVNYNICCVISVPHQIRELTTFLHFRMLTVRAC